MITKKGISYMGTEGKGPETGVLNQDEKTEGGAGFKKKGTQLRRTGPQ